MREKTNKLKLKLNNYIAYHSSEVKGSKVTVVFCGGFRSDMTGTKAVFLEKFCRKNKISFIRFDYFGHGSSSGKFESGTIGAWKQNVIDVIDNLTKGKVILVGSSLGGWLSMLATMARPKRVAGFLGLASAPDFTEYLMWEKLPKAIKQQIQKKGIYLMPVEGDCDPYPIVYDLILEAREHLLLHKPINITAPVRLIHGMKDDDVPYQTSVKIAELVKTKDVEVILRKDGGHRLSKETDLELIGSTLLKLIRKV